MALAGVVCPGLGEEAVGGSHRPALVGLWGGDALLRLLDHDYLTLNWSGSWDHADGTAANDAVGCPGALGVVLRKLLIPGLLAEVGSGTIWGHGVVLRHPGRMSIGRGVVVDDSWYFDAKGCEVGESHIGDGAFISRGCIVSGKDGALTLGPRVHLGASCILYASTGLSIGADTMLAANCYMGAGVVIPMPAGPARSPSRPSPARAW